jgi:DNA-binding transcriptional regulator LsrR (DeoR family)
MPNRPISAKTLLEILRLYYCEGRGFGSIARELGVSRWTVRKYIREVSTICKRKN